MPGSAAAPTPGEPHVASVQRRDVRHTAAVVLNYRTAEQTIRAVRSLQGSGAGLDVVVVDNASNDGSAERFRAELTDVAVIVAPTNGGFSAGCNLGIQAALDRGADAVLLLNSDAVATAGAIEQLIATV